MTTSTTTALCPDMRFSWEIKSVDAVFNNGVARYGTSLVPTSYSSVIIYTRTRGGGLWWSCNCLPSYVITASF